MIAMLTIGRPPCSSSWSPIGSMRREYARRLPLALLPVNLATRPALSGGYVLLGRFASLTSPVVGRLGEQARRIGLLGRRSQVVRQRSAKPSSRVRFPPSPQIRTNRGNSRGKAEVDKTSVACARPRPAWKRRSPQKSGLTWQKSAWQRSSVRKDSPSANCSRFGPLTARQISANLIVESTIGGSGRCARPIHAARSSRARARSL